MSLDWQNTNHLLLCWLDETTDVQVFITLLHLLKQSLPQVEITLLISNINLLDSNVQKIICPRWSDYSKILESLHSNAFDAALIFTAPTQSPYSIAYLCYLAGIPIRVGQSQEFGGGVLSHCIPPLLEPVEPINYHLHLFQASGLPISLPSTQPLESPKISYAATNYNLACSR